MARARNIKPGFFDNEDLADCGAEGQLLYAGLWTLADCRGVLEDRPKRIKARIYPYSDYDVPSLLAMLAERGFIVRYESNGCKCILIPTFDKHQTPHSKEPENGLPMPPEADLDKSRASTGRASGLPEIAVIKEEGFKREGIKESRKRDSRRARAANGFDEFYAAYPVHAGRSDALKAWKKLKPEEQAAATSAVADFASSPKGKGDFCPYPATWLNQRRWEDDRAEWHRVQSSAQSTNSKQASIYGGGLSEILDP